MKRFTIVLLIVAIMTVFPVIALAGDDCPHSKANAEKKADEQPPVNVAVYSVPDLSQDVAVKIASVLNENKGIMGAKPDLENKQMSVVFKTELTNQDAVTKALVEVSPQTTFVSVRAAEEKDIKDCSKCPSRKTCQKAKS